jgi:hypothetical protein
MNFNTITGYVNGTKRNQIPTLTLAATTETAIPVTTDSGTTSAILAVPTQTAIVGSSNPLGVNANAALLGGSLGEFAQPLGTNRPYFNSDSFDLARPFSIRLVGIGSAAANAGNTLTVKIYQGTSATLGSDTLFATPISAVATASAANLRFDITVRCYWDSTSNTLAGVFSGNYTYNSTTTAIANTAVTTLSSISSVASLSFLASVTWGNAVGGVIKVSEFSISQD